MSKNTNNLKEFWDDIYSEFNPNEEVIGDLDLSNLNIDIKGKNILICAVGTGKEVIRAARIGAEVHGIDISSKAVENARDMLKANNLKANIIVGNAYETEYEDNSFDLIWGSAVLHHLDHHKTADELYRIIRPDGLVIFISEPTFFNLLIKFAYEFCFGKGRENRRKKFLFFTRRGDEFEKPIDYEDMLIYEKIFNVDKRPKDLMFIEKLAHSLFPYNHKMHRIFSKVDSFFNYFFPKLKKYYV
jgi:ubiquinone/menaquinone biosynthesis C-methylase UbiE